MDDSNYKSLNPNSRYIKGILYMKFLYVCLMGLMLSAQANTAQPSTVAGQVQRADGRPVAGAQVTLFDLADLHQGAVARAMTNAAGHFALSLQSFSAGTALPDGFALGQNYPNPFNPSTIIPYQIPASAHVRLEVFNMLGQRLATLVDAERPAGAHTAQWDGTDAAGRAVGAGVYIYRLSSGEVSVSRRMVLVDGQAGMPAAGGAPGPVRAVEGLVEADGPVYGLTVSGEGLVPYVDPAFQVEAGRAWVEVVLAAPARAKRLPGEDRLLGDVDGKGRVDIVDALLVAASVGPTGLTTGGDLDGVDNGARLGLIDLGDVNGDGVVNLVDAYLIGVYSVNPSDPVLPAGIGKRVSFASDGTPNKMYWTDQNTNKIQRANLDGTNVEDLITNGLVHPDGIALDVGRGKMYWTDATTTDSDTRRIQRANLDGTNVEDLITNGLGHPVGLALDVGQGKMYWTDLGTDKIQRANLDGTNVEDLITHGLDLPKGLALDVGRGKMYWTDPSRRRIQRANLDGTNVEDLITNRLSQIKGLALDVGRGKMYWTDPSRRRIQRANLDGTNVEDLITNGLVHPDGIALDVGRGKMYWTDATTGKIQRANLDGTNVEDLITNGLNRPAGLALAALAGSDVSGENGGSSRPDLVVESPSVSDNPLTTGQSFTLSATVRNRGNGQSASTTLRYYRSDDSTISTTDGQVGTDTVSGLSASATSAESINLTAPSSAGTYYYGACVESVSDESDTNNNCSTGVLVMVGSPDPIVELPNKMYWADSGTNKIQRANLDGTNVEDLITGLRLRGLALDVGRGKMYWTASSADKIQQANLDGTNVEDLITHGLSHPVGLALDVGRGKMYWINWGTRKIQRANLDGTNVEDLITGLDAPEGLALDVGRGKMYWADAGTGSIQRANLDGTNVEDLITNGLDAPIGLALDVGRGKMYWTDAGTDKIQRANLDGSNVEDLITHGLSNRNPVGLALDVGRGKMYWTDWVTHKIQRANLDGTNVEDLITHGLSHPVGLALVALADSDVSGGDGGSSRPDLVVESPSVSDNPLTTGQSFTLSATVRNRGNGQSASTTLRYYRSDDSTISTTDGQVGTDTVSGLSASATSAESINLTAPSSAGTYYYGACVESVSDESDTNNNCSTGVLVTVGSPDPIVELPNKIYWTDQDTGKIQRANLDGSNVEDLITGLVVPDGIALDGGRGKMYWTQWGMDTGKIQRANLDGSNVEDLITGLERPSGIALDVGRGKMYWTDAGTDKIQRANLDGSNVEDLITSGISPTRIALDVERGKMYWTQWGAPGKIQRANLDGSNVEDLITSAGELKGRGIALDGVNGKIYWSETPSLKVSSSRIRRANLDGSNVEDLITNGLEYPIAIALDVGRGKMYWADVLKSKIQRANLDGSNVEDRITHGFYYPLAIALVALADSAVSGGGSRPGPDLVVEKPSFSDDRLRTGQSFTLSATVRNLGNGRSASTTLRYYRSDDSTISPNDRHVGTGNVSGLSASATSAESINLTAPSSVGEYYYGACVESVTDESDTNNNCSIGVRVTVRSRPDLVVENPSVRDNSLTTGQSFTLSATVRNRGNVRSASTTLRYYRSDDSTISPNDRQVGTDTVRGLSASATASESIYLTAPSRAGTYYYGACVESVADESDTSNNCSTGVRVTVDSGGGGSSRPDLVVESPSVSDNTLTAGQSFTLRATVRNRGNGRSASTTLRYYRSSNSSISTNDRQVGTDNVRGLSASATASESIRLTAPSRAGTYYYGACVESVTDESDTNNNCSTGVRVTVRSGGGGDLDDHSDTRSGATDLSLGDARSGRIETGGDVDYFRVQVSSSGILTVYTTGDTDTYGTLQNSSGSDLEDDDEAGLSNNFRIERSVSEGTYYIRVRGYDSSTTGSYTVRTRFRNGGGGSSRPDLVVESPSVSDNTLTAGQSFTLRATVRNRGNARSASTTLLYYYRSDDSTLSRPVGTDNVSGLSASATSAESIRLNAPSNAGTYYYGACVESVADESDTSNNCSTGVIFTVSSGGGGSTRPDLVVESPSVSDNTLTAGQSFTLRATVRNRGNARSASTTLLYYYRSDDSSIVGTDTVSGLSASATSAESISLIAPSRAGTYYYGACVESVPDESDTNNNCSTEVLVTVSSDGGGSSRPDLVVESPSVSDNTLAAGQSFTLSATVHNRGNGRSASTTLRYYRSSNSSISTNDRQVGTDTVSGLSASATSAESISLIAPSRAGTYYYGACVESVPDESDTNNNCSTEVRVMVGSGGGGNDDHSNTRSGATNLPLDDSRSGRIETGGDIDYFQVQVSSSGTLTVYTTGRTDTWGTLQNSSGSDLANDDDGGDGNNFRIERTVTPGTYYLRVRGYDSSKTGSYTVHARFQRRDEIGGGGNDDHSDTRSGATFLPLGGSVLGRIDTGGDVDYFRVQVSSSGILTVYTTGDTDTYGTLQNSSGSDLASDDDGGSDNNFSIARSVSAGTYYIRVRGYDSSATGSYTVRASFQSDDTDFNIELVFLNSVLTSSQSNSVKQIVQQAATRWESVITGDLPEVDHSSNPCDIDMRIITRKYTNPPIRVDDVVDDLRIFVHVDSIDGSRRTLAQATPLELRDSLLLPAIAVIILDERDISSSSSSYFLQRIVLHEMAHALGFTADVWNEKNLMQGHVWDTLFGLLLKEDRDVRFIGRRAIGAFNNAGGRDDKVPVENYTTDGKRKPDWGTEYSHWRESVFREGNKSELMVGRVDTSYEFPLSAITIQSFADLGYQVDASQADPYTIPSPPASKPVAGHSLELNCSLDVRSIPVVDENGRIVRTITPFAWRLPLGRRVD